MTEPEQRPEPASLPRTGPHLAAGDGVGLLRRVEEASLNAWPAMQTLLLDGWVIRLARGFTKRANSVTPLYPGFADPHTKVRFCENLYARERLKAIFRITSIGGAEALDTLLDERGYTHQDLTEVLHCSLDGEDTTASRATPPHPDTPLQIVPLGIWLDVYAELSGLQPQTRTLHGQLLRGIALPCCHAILGTPTAPLACGLAVLEGDLVGLFDVVTRADARRAGHGHALVAGLLAWGRAAGARRAYLQMVADNHPAAGLYRKLGFEPLYRYWYRISS